MYFPNDTINEEHVLESETNTPQHSRSNSLDNSFSSENSDEVDIVESRKRAIEKEYERVTNNIIHMGIVLVLIVLHYFNLKYIFGYE